MSKPLNTTNPLKNISVETLKRTFEASRSPLIITDHALPDNPIIYSNQAFLDLTGYDMDEIIGRNCRFLQGSDTKKVHVKALHDAVHDGTSARTVLKNYRKDGSEFYNDLLISPIHDSAGKITHFVGMQLDITDRIYTEQRLIEESRALEETNRELEQFTYVASHDLQEPLRMISSYLQLIDKRYSNVLDDDGKTFLAYANEGAERMQAFIYDLLTLSRLSSTDGRFVDTNLNELIQRVLENLHVSISESGAKVNVDALPTLSVDPTQIIQLFQNLVGNAIKYTAPGRSPVISITVRHSRGLYTFTVTDNGIGIDKRHFKRIFMVFQRLHTRSEYKGTGVGLAIVAKIVARHGGTVWVESSVGKGSSFKFTLPVRR